MLNETASPLRLPGWNRHWLTARTAGSTNAGSVAWRARASLTPTELVDDEDDDDLGGAALSESLVDPRRGLVDDSGRLVQVRERQQVGRVGSPQGPGARTASARQTSRRPWEHAVTGREGRLQSHLELREVERWHLLLGELELRRSCRRVLGFRSLTRFFLHHGRGHRAGIDGVQADGRSRIVSHALDDRQTEEEQGRDDDRARHRGEQVEHELEERVPAASCETSSKLRCRGFDSLLPAVRRSAVRSCSGESPGKFLPAMLTGANS